jgi:hypothetical protein
MSRRRDAGQRILRSQVPENGDFPPAVPSISISAVNSNNRIDYVDSVSMLSTLPAFVARIQYKCLFNVVSYCSFGRRD